MSRSGYIDDFIDDHWRHIIWRGAVIRALKGKRGQAFLKEMLQAMDAMPEKKLIDSSLEIEGAVCAIGSVGKARGIDMGILDPEDYDSVANTFGIAPAMVREIVYMNDEASAYNETDEQRFLRMRRWIAGEIKVDEERT